MLQYMNLTLLTSGPLAYYKGYKDLIVIWKKIVVM